MNNLKRTAVAAAVTAVMGVPAVASADTISMNFTGVFTLVGGTGGVNTNSDAAGATDGQGNSYLFGSRTPVSGTASFDTVSGAGSAVINPFSFFGNGLAEATAVSFQAIGDGFGNPGPLVAGAMGFNWNGNVGIPVTAIFNAQGFFAAVGASNPGDNFTVQTGCAACVVSSTPDTLFGTAVGAVPMGMTTYNTAGTTLGSLFPLTTDGISGVPMTTAPFPGQNANFDFTTINATNVPQVPVPAAVWLFGSGLLGLVGVARRRRS